jgi:hypothetical protein
VLQYPSCINNISQCDRCQLFAEIRPRPVDVGGILSKNRYRFKNETLKGKHVIIWETGILFNDCMGGEIC